MEDGHFVAEPGPEAADRLRSQGDFGNEDDRPPALPLNDLAKEMDVDEGLARPGDALKEEGRGIRVPRGLDESTHCVALSLR